MSVKTNYGELEGVVEKGYTVYKGVPYAKPPIGDLRWKEPQRMDAWEGVYQAKEFGNICVQELPNGDNKFTKGYLKEFYSNEAFIPNRSEDCLYLNIWMPEGVEGVNEKKLPVAFWIHGGGFGGGYSSEIEFDGEAYCKKDVILVTINYRVGIFGFLAHPWLSEKSERGISGNYGILDQIAALRWVYENIEFFGGNKENITVFGQSAGSMSTQILVSSDLTENMIAKAILQSGVRCEEGFLYTPSLQEEEEIGKEFVELAGVNCLEDLEKLTAEELMTAKEKLDGILWKTGRGISVVPNVDGYILKETVVDAYENGRVKDIPYMIGSVTDDLGSTPEEIKAKQPGMMYREAINWSLKREELGTKPSYVYYFSHELPGDQWGAFHSGEIWYMFGTLGRCWRPMGEEDYALSEKMVSYWTNFMKNGDPNEEGIPKWESCTKEKMEAIYLR